MLNNEPSEPISKNDLNPIPKAIVVNDNVTQLKILCGLLHKAGLDPIPFKSAEAALAAMGKDLIPDLIVTDVYMPGTDGLELTWERADPALAHLPIIALTTLSNEDAVAAGKAAGVSAYEVKLDKEKLIQSVRQNLPA